MSLTHRIYLPAILIFCWTFPMATSGEPVVFAALGCGPYARGDKPAAAFYVRQENLEGTSEFMVHLGDVFKRPPVKRPANGAPAPSGAAKSALPPMPDQMPSELEYRETADLLTTGNEIPTWIIPGDNEWNDLEDPVLAWKWWQKYYARFEERFQPQWKTQRQPERPENFAFVRKGVLFVGVNVVGGRIHDPAEWRVRLPQSAAWIKQVLDQPASSDLRAAVIFAQANPFVIRAGEPKDKFKPFLVPFRQCAADWKKPILFLHSDGHVWIDDQPWPEKNIRRVQVDKWDEKFPTIQITVADTGDVKSIFQIDRRLNNPKWKYEKPVKSAETKAGS